MKPCFPSHPATPVSHHIRVRTAHGRSHPRGRATVRPVVERLEQRALLSTTTIQWTPSIASPVYGQAETLTATVTPASPADGTPTGTVTFVDYVDYGVVLPNGNT
jgi:hypothetical protein